MSDVPPRDPPLPPSPPVADVRTGPPWESGGPVVSRFLETVRGVLFEPARLFAAMRRTGGFQAPLIFALVGVAVGALASVVYQGLLSALSLGMFGDTSAALGAAWALYSLVMAPVIGVLAVFIGAGVCHGVLLLVNGARQPFEATVRVVAYVLGGTSVLNVIPFCGGIIGAVWALVSAIVGLAQAHEIPTGTAAAAVLVPAGVSCFCGIALTLLFYSALAVLGGWGPM